MDKWDIMAVCLIILFLFVFIFAGVRDYYKQQLSAKTNEYERAVRQAAYNKTHLCLDDGTFYEVKIYRMDGNMEFYVVRPVK